MKKRLAIMFALLLSVLLYTGRRLGLSGQNAALFAPVLFFILFGWQFIYRLRPEAYSRLWFKVLAWSGAFLFGIWGVFMLLILPFDIVSLLADPFLTTPSSWNNQSVIIIFLIISTFIGVVGLLQALIGPRIKHVEVKIAKLPSHFGKFKIVQISDLHIGATIRSRYVRKVVDIVNSQSPDIIAITGDLADGEVEVLNDELKPLALLKSNYGIYFITGNHEYYSGVEPWLKKLVELKITPLINENKLISFESNKILVAGVTDPVGRAFHIEHKADVLKASQDSYGCQLKILLAHQPNACFEASKAGFDLQLSGHTHAGQFFPFNLLVRFAHRYYKGLNLHEKLWVYVNQGTGYWGPPLRFLVPSEITVLEVTGSESSAS